MKTSFIMISWGLNWEKLILYEGADVVGDINKEPKCLLRGAEVSLHQGPKCLDEGPKCLFQKGPKCPIGAEVVGVELVGAEVSKIPKSDIVVYGIYIYVLGKV